MIAAGTRSAEDSPRMLIWPAGQLARWPMGQLGYGYPAGYISTSAPLAPCCHPLANREQPHACAGGQAAIVVPRRSWALGSCITLTTRNPYAYTHGKEAVEFLSSHKWAPFQGSFVRPPSSPMPPPCCHHFSWLHSDSRNLLQT